MRWSVAIALCIGLVALGLVLGSGVGAAQDEAGVSIRLEPVNDTIQEDDTARFAVVASELDDGLSSYNVTITSEDASVAYVWNEEYGVQGSSRATYRNYRREARQLQVEDVEADVQGEVTLAHVVVLGDEPGSVDLAIDAPTLVAEDGTPYDVVETSGADVTVEMDRPGARVQFGQADTRDPFDNVVGPDQRTYWDLAFYDLDDGLRNLTYEVTVEDPDVATVENVTFPASATTTNVTRAPETGVTRVEAVGLNLTDGQGPTVGSAIVRAAEPGETAVSVDVLGATNASGDRYRITSQRGGEVAVVPWRGSAEVRVEPSDEQFGDGVAYDVVATNLTAGLSEYELHVHSLGESVPDYEELPERDVRHGGLGVAPREGSLRIDVREIRGDIDRTEVTLLRVTLDEAATLDTVDPEARPIYVLAADGRAYDVGYTPLRETGAGADGEDGPGGGAGAIASDDSGPGPATVAIGLAGVGLVLVVALLAARRR